MLLVREFTTHHQLNPTILAKYRAVKAWYFSVYKGIELVEIYRLTPAQLEPYFQKWEKKWYANRKDINNPKISVAFVKKNGERVFVSWADRHRASSTRPPRTGRRNRGSRRSGVRSRS